jgi:hypothetical protein
VISPDDGERADSGNVDFRFNTDGRLLEVILLRLFPVKASVHNLNKKLIGTFVGK